MPAASQIPSLVDQIDEYIRQHRYWKTAILEAIQTGKSEHSPAEIATDNRCAFGKWLYAATSEVTRFPQYDEVKRLHAEFHKKASKTLADALGGHRDRALEDLEKGEFSDASSALVMCLTRWKRSLG